MRKEIASVILILLAACVNKPGQPVQEAILQLLLEVRTA